MNDIINERGEYISLTFTGKKGTWHLIGSESSGDTPFSHIPVKWTERSLGFTVDTFVNKETNEYWEITRRDVYKFAEAKKICAKLSL